jgi:hypothetical protein
LLDFEARHGRLGERLGCVIIQLHQCVRLDFRLSEHGFRWVAMRSGRMHSECGGPGAPSSDNAPVVSVFFTRTGVEFEFIFIKQSLEDMALILLVPRLCLKIHW